MNALKDLDKTSLLILREFLLMPNVMTTCQMQTIANRLKISVYDVIDYKNEIIEKIDFQLKGM